MAEGIRLCKAATIAPGEVRQIEIAGHDEPFALFNLDGVFHLTEDTCTHAFASLSEGDIRDGCIVCPLHGGSFEIATGEPVDLPCNIPLRTFRVWIDGDDIVTDLAPAISA
jgi:nitrite reductase/ring-hydroxylating ferredoxin subunit